MSKNRRELANELLEGYNSRLDIQGCRSIIRENLWNRGLTESEYWSRFPDEDIDIPEVEVQYEIIRKFTKDYVNEVVDFRITEGNLECITTLLVNYGMAFESTSDMIFLALMDEEDNN